MIKANNFTEELNNNKTIKWKQESSGMYTSKIRANETRAVESAIVCKTPCEMFKWIKENA